MMDINKDELLNRAKEELKNEVSNIAFETWIKPLGIQSIHDNHIVFTVTSVFQKDFINTRYKDLLLTKSGISLLLMFQILKMLMRLLMKMLKIQILLCLLLLRMRLMRIEIL